MPSGSTLYGRVGGDAFFGALVERFYASVEGDSVLRPLYPADLTPGKAHLTMFLIQLAGGPPRYNQERGRPHLPVRHRPFSIGQQERDVWVRHMTAAVRSSTASPEDQDYLIAYFERTASFLVNRH
ncbi:MAG: globin [Dehalococcoidia bacterium]|nr:globin [Dehalococcoidia bacterium]